MTDEQFMRAWLKASEHEQSIKELSEEIEMDYKKVHNQYLRLKSQGVHLPALFGQRTRTSKQAQRLNKLIAAWRAKREAQLKQV